MNSKGRARCLPPDAQATSGHGEFETAVRPHAARRGVQVPPAPPHARWWQEIRMYAVNGGVQFLLLNVKNTSATVPSCARRAGRRLD